jgi:hypothetical protein
MKMRDVRQMNRKKPVKEEKQLKLVEEEDEDADQNV